MRDTTQQRTFEEEFLKKVFQKLSVISDNVKTMYPYTTVDGRYDNDKRPPFSWTCGFWGGIQWLLYKYSGEDKFLKLAEKCSARMTEGLDMFTPLGHDVGFQYLHTTVNSYLITQNERDKTVAMHAAVLLAGRYNIAGQYIRAWNEGTGIDPTESKAGYAIIDCMMNIPLLYWAWKESGDPRFFQIANSHADTVMKTFLREDGSVEHIVVFDPENGKIVNKPRGQGYAEGTSWTRGQAWAIYGFSVAYMYTGKKEYLETALKVANYFIENMKEETVPPIDFKQPAEPYYIDTTAGMVAAAGMTILKNYVDENSSENLEKMICKLLDGAYENCNFDLEEDSVLQNGSEKYHSEAGIHIPIIYGDYYLIETLMLRRGEKLTFVSEVI